VSKPVVSKPLCLPFDSAAHGAPPAEYAMIRAEEKTTRVVLPSGCPSWLATSYADTATVLADPRLSRNLRYPGAPRVTPGFDPSDDPNSMVNMDPPEHTRLRRLVRDAFSRKQAEAWRPRAQRIADDLVDSMESLPQPADFLAAFAAPLPIRVICAVLGIAPEEVDRVRACSDVLVALTSHPIDEVIAAYTSLVERLTEVIAHKRRHPGDDLLDLLIAPTDGDDRLTEEELVAMTCGMLVAGHETTINVLSRGMLTLLRNPRQLAMLRADPDLLPAAVEEILRHTPPGDYGLLRVATKEVSLSTATIPAGDGIIGSISAANRDPAQFPDPDTFDITRPNVSTHLAFGRGPHYCLGASLARIELEVAFQTLLDRLPRLALAVPLEDLRWSHGWFVKSLATMPVVW
jgi:cytochrome P450